MKGNINKNVEIKESDRYFYNVLMEKRIVNPRDPLHPIVRTYLKVFRNVDYKKYFECSQDQQIEYLKAMNYQAAELVHDPTIAVFTPVAPIEVKVIKSETAPKADPSVEEKARVEKKIKEALNPIRVTVRKPIKRKK
jgi:hypothetical protein